MAAPPDLLTLSPETIHIWHAILDRAPAQIAVFFTILSLDERARAQRLLPPQGRDRVIVARALLRQLLARYVRRDPASLRFAYSPQGKPALDPPVVHFNLSHSAHRLLIAVSTHPVGVDLEEIHPLEFQSMARAALPPEAQAELARASADNIADVFFRLWTRHEARAKAGGAGITAQVPEIPAWDIDVGPGFRAAIATAVPQPRLVLREIAA